jgi:hypothetical protein
MEVQNGKFPHLSVLGQHLFPHLDFPPPPAGDKFEPTAARTREAMMTEPDGKRTYSNIKHTILVLSGKGGSIVLSTLTLLTFK